MISLVKSKQKEKEGFRYHVTPIRYNNQLVVLSFRTEAFRLENRIGQVFVKLRSRNDFIYDILHSIRPLSWNVSRVQTSFTRAHTHCKPKCDLSFLGDRWSEDYIVQVKISNVFEGCVGTSIKRGLKSIRKA